MRRVVPTLLFGSTLLASASLLAQSDIVPAACPPEGDAIKSKLRKLNEARARLDDVTDDDVDDAVTMEQICEPGDDRLRWQDGQGVEITAYVVDVRDAGPSSSCCHSSRSVDHDTILELAPDAVGVDRSHRFYAVVTRQWREAVLADRVDWTTGSLRAHYLQRWVVVRGWLLYNPEAEASSLHTAALAGPAVSRMSAWEIHPVTAIEDEDEVPEEQALLPLPAGEGRGEGAPDRRPASLYARSNTSSSAP
jgi:hypothetical protein